ncbi:MAG TPA: hypothetical protein DDW52_12210 [Planctomycetaceae bacterium]|nr:hypothetical protein [Planctomycetaceae bacterium]
MILRNVLFILVFTSIANIRCARAAEALTTAKTLGPVSVACTLTPAAPMIGDSMQLDIVVTAEEGVELLLPEFGESLGRFSISSFVPSRTTDGEGKQVARQTYTLQATRSGPQWITPVLVEFVDRRPGKKPSPDDFDAYEILTDRMDFEVTSVLGNKAEFNPPLGKLEQPAKAQGSSWGLYAAIAITIVAIAAGSALWLRGRQRVKLRSSFEIAWSKLKQLRADQTQPTPQLSPELFFVEVSSVIREYLEQRFALRARDLTTDEFLQAAAGHSELTSEHRRLLSDFLTQADAVKFAGVSASERDIDESLKLAEQFVIETRSDQANIAIEDLNASVARGNTPDYTTQSQELTNPTATGGQS